MDNIPVNSLFGFVKNGVRVGRVMVLPHVPDRKTGLIIPDSQQNKDKPTIARVIKVSREVEADPDMKEWVKPGALVLHARFQGAVLEHQGKKYSVINADEIYCDLAEEAL